MDANQFKYCKNFGHSLFSKIEKLKIKHEQVDETKPITIEAIDEIIKDAVLMRDLVDELEEMTKHINKTVMRLEQKAGSYLKALKREDYISPYGVVQIMGKWSVRMPKDDESKMLTFGWLKEKGIFERYATVNVRSLNSLYMKEWEAAKKKDPDAWMTFSIPGVDAPVFDEFTKIKSNNKRKDVTNETEEQ